MNVENIRKKVDLLDDDDIYLGPFTKIARSNLKNPSITFFRHRKQQNVTNHICYPTIIVNKYNIKLDEKNGDVANQLVISLYKKDEFDDLKKIIIKMSYENIEIVNYSLHDISNIYKMFPEYYENKFTNKKNNVRTYNIDINTLLNLNVFELDKKINIEIIGINNADTQLEVFFDSYILTKTEHDRFLTSAHEDEFYQYKMIECKNNEELKLALSNNIIIEKLLVCGDYIDNVTFKDEEINP